MRRPCTADRSEYIDLKTLEPILSSRLVIPMDKGNGEVRPISVGEVIRRIIGKFVTQVTKQDTLESTGSLQLCPGHKSRSEEAMHAINAQLILARGDQFSVHSGCAKRLQLTKSSNTLHNIRVLCPAINTYWAPARRFIVTGDQELISAEGTTQGDPPVNYIYALSLQPLISRLQAVKQAVNAGLQIMWQAVDRYRTSGCGGTSW